MKNISREKLIQRFHILSDRLQDVIFSEVTAGSIRKAAILGAFEDKVDVLARMVGLVLMGYLNPLDFEKEIKNEFSISDQHAKQIVGVLKNEVFDLVKDDLRKLYPPTIKTPTVVDSGFAPSFSEPEQKNNTGDANFFVSKNKDKTNKETSNLSEFEKRFLSHKFKKPEKQTEKNNFSHLEAKKYRKEVEKEIKIRPEISSDTDLNKTKKQNTSFDVNKNNIQTPKDDVWGDSVKMGQTMQSGGDENIKKENKNYNIDPVIPIPTFIKSQFQPQTRKKSILKSHNKEVTDKDKNQNKDNGATDGFIVDTDNKNKKMPKVDGNVIDLRDL